MKSDAGSRIQNPQSGLMEASESRGKVEDAKVAQQPDALRSRFDVSVLRSLHDEGMSNQSAGSRIRTCEALSSGS